MSKQQIPEIIRIIVVCGPTATGKSDFAVSLAKKIGGEVISADSRQVYKGMDLGTGKITKKEMQGILHHLLDIADPKKTSMNVVKFKNLALKKIQVIYNHGKVPILVGGTGFWLDAVAMNQTFPNVGVNKKLRKELSKLNTEEMFKKLQSLDPDRAKKIDSKNKHRLIRAIEIVEGLKNIPPQKAKQPKVKIQATYIGLDLPQEELDERIKNRLDKRLKQGMIAEVESLYKSGLSWKKLESFGLEYRYIALYLQGKLTWEQMKEQLFFAIRHYARRQRTWFKRNKEIHWTKPSLKNPSSTRVFSLVFHSLPGDYPYLSILS
jgi:tRNA dimethylallyltransferase